MNVIEFKALNKDIVFCFVDNSHSIQDGWSRELIKNLSDFTISNLYCKDYTVLQGLDEDELLQYASKKYKFACVFSSGTEFINGFDFFNHIEELVKKDFFICGHILDRQDAYYELHSQCYLINLKQYKKLGCPPVGKQQLGSSHRQEKPWRSQETHHDSHTPIWVSGGDTTGTYAHKCHGWNILSIGFQHDLNMLVWDTVARQSKRHHYPESPNDFLEKLQWLHFRERYCATEFVHNKNNEWTNNVTGTLRQLVVPASGTLYFDLLDPTQENTVIFYDYNLKALTAWQEQAPKIKNVTYKFVHWDLLAEEIDISIIDNSVETLINLSNIFAYEGTSVFNSLKYRVYKENQLLSNLKKHIPEAQINFSLRAASGFDQVCLTGKVKDIALTDISNLRKPTWRFNQDWL